MEYMENNCYNVKSFFDFKQIKIEFIQRGEFNVLQRFFQKKAVNSLFLAC